MKKGSVCMSWNVHKKYFAFFHLECIGVDPFGVGLDFESFGSHIGNQSIFGQKMLIHPKCS